MIDTNWIEALRAWADGKPQVREVYLFGSRVKGTSRVDSDLDIAVRIESANETPLTTWIFEGKEWAEELDALLPVPVQLEMLDEDDTVVLPAVQEHGRRIYP